MAQEYEKHQVTRSGKPNCPQIVLLVVAYRPLITERSLHNDCVYRLGLVSRGA